MLLYSSRRKFSVFESLNRPRKLLPINISVWCLRILQLYSKEESFLSFTSDNELKSWALGKKPAANRAICFHISVYNFDLTLTGCWLENHLILKWGACWEIHDKQSLCESLRNWPGTWNFSFSNQIVVVKNAVKITEWSLGDHPESCLNRALFSGCLKGMGLRDSR